MMILDTIVVLIRGSGEYAVAQGIRLMPRAYAKGTDAGTVCVFSCVAGLSLDFGPVDSGGGPQYSWQNGGM